MTPTNDATRIRVSGPSGLLAVVPTMLGYHPTNSLVLICLSGGGCRVGPIARVDLPAGHDRALAANLTGHALRYADDVVLVSYQDTRRRPPVLGDVLRALDRAGVDVMDVLVVYDGIARSARGGRIEHALPGFVVPGPDDPQVRALTAAAVLAGRTLLPDRDAIRRSIAPPVGQRLQDAERCIDAAASGASIVGSGTADRRGCLGPRPDLADRFCDFLDTLELGLAQVSTTGAVQVGTAAAVAVGMADLEQRDFALERALAELERPWLPMLISCATWTPPSLAPPLCAVLATVAYRHGDGALAQVAVDRCLQAEPEHRLALLMIAIMSAGVHPDVLDRIAASRLPFDEIHTELT